MIFPKKKRIFIALGLLCAALVCLFAASRLPRRQQSQFAAERWAGESGETFAQFSCFLPPTETLGTEQVYGLRQSLSEKLVAASIEMPSGGKRFTDAWSGSGRTKVSGALGSFDAAVRAVGGSYFDFHPVTLRSGGFLAEGDLMRDRVVLDEQLAWLLFGSVDVTGMNVSIGGVEYLIAGVVATEENAALRKAAEAMPTLYLPFDTWEQSGSGARVDCYEVVLPEPVEGFGNSVLKSISALSGALLRQNTGRFTFSASLKTLRDLGTLPMRTQAVAFPTWENAALSTEVWCAVLRALALALLVYPAALALVVLVRAFRQGKRALRGSGKRLWEKLQDMRER